IDHGHLSVGERMLANVGAFESRAAVLMHDLDAKRASLEAALKGAAEAMDRDQLESAARYLIEARANHADDERVTSLVAQAVDRLNDRISKSIESARLDMAETLSRTLARLAPDATSSDHLSRAIEQCRMAWNYL